MFSFKNKFREQTGDFSSIYIHHKVWDEIIYPFPNFNGCIVEVWE